MRPPFLARSLVAGATRDASQAYQALQRTLIQAEYEAKAAQSPGPLYNVTHTNAGLSQSYNAAAILNNANAVTTTIPRLG